MLADTDKAVAAAYGTLGPMGFPRRSVFVIDAHGVVRWSHRSIAGLSFHATASPLRRVEVLPCAFAATALAGCAANAWCVRAED